MSATHTVNLDDTQLEEAIALYKEEYPEAVRQTIEFADYNVRNCFKLLYTMSADRWIDIGNPPNWLYDSDGELEFTWILNRHEHLMRLAKAYRFTGDEAYIETYVRHVRSWVEQNPVPHGLPYEELAHFQQPGPWRLLETGLRSINWAKSYQWIKNSPTLDDSFRSLFFRSLSEHANFLAKYWGDPDINHAMMSMEGLITVAVLCQGEPDSDYWARVAMERLELCMYRQVGADGVQREMSTMYHNGAITNFLVPYLLAEKRGTPFPEAYRDSLIRMGDFTLHTTRPDGVTSATADSDEGRSAFRLLGTMGLAFGKPEWSALAQPNEQLLWLFGSETYNRCKQNAAPSLDLLTELPSYAFPLTGYYMMRGTRDYVLFDAVRMTDAHAHADILHFEWMHASQQVFIDSGRFTYVEGDWRRYFKSTSAHNTIEIDGLDQTPYVSTQQWGTPEAVPSVHRWLSEAEYDFVDASHTGYTRLSEPVVHRRWLLFGKKTSVLVVVDWLEGEGVHQMTQRFHLHPGVSVSAEGLAVEGNEPELGFDVRMQWAVDGDRQNGQIDREIEEGWMSPAYGTKLATPVIATSCSFTGTLGIATICLPRDRSGDAGSSAIGGLTINNMTIDRHHRRLELAWTDAQGTACDIVITMDKVDIR